MIKKTSEKDALFISNSMPIGDVDNLLLNKNIDAYAIVINGIDGIVSTCMGMVIPLTNNLSMVDLSFYHDMNGLLMSKLNNIQMNIVFYKQSWRYFFIFTQKESATDYFERLFGTPTGLDFEYPANLYQFNFQTF